MNIEFTRADLECIAYTLDITLMASCNKLDELKQTECPVTIGIAIGSGAARTLVDDIKQLAKTLQKITRDTDVVDNKDESLKALEEVFEIAEQWERALARGDRSDSETVKELNRLLELETSD